MSAREVVRDERGDSEIVALVLMTPVLLLFLGAVTLFFAILDARGDVDAIAAALARSIAVAPDRGQAIADADALATALALTYQLDSPTVTYDIPLDFGRGAAFSVTISATVDIAIPLLGIHTATVERTQHERLASNRSRGARPPPPARALLVAGPPARLPLA